MPSSSCKEFVPDVLLLQAFCLELSKTVLRVVIKTAANVGMWEALLKSVNCSHQDILQIYTSMVRSVLEYACQVRHTSLTKNNRANWSLFSEERSVSCSQTSHNIKALQCLECRRYINVRRTFAVLSLGSDATRSWTAPPAAHPKICWIWTPVQSQVRSPTLQERPLREDLSPLRTDSPAITFNIISIHSVTF